MTGDFRRALRCAQYYRDLGLCPLPSRPDDKRPMLPSYADYWESPVPNEVYSEERWRTSNIQVMTGAKTPGATKIIVVDCDGDEALMKWARMCVQHGSPDTWKVRTGSGGTHEYFRLPEGVTECPSGMIWGLWDTFGEDGKGQWLKHKEVRILGDNALAVAPPSLHVKTGRRYEFLAGADPHAHRLPALAPEWLLALPRLVAPRCQPAPQSRPPLESPIRLSGAFYRREEVLAAIDDKIALAASWGLRMASRGPNPKGWVSCYAVGREDNTPSASFHALDGTYQDRKDMRSISLFDLGVELGQFSDWRQARDWCGDRYLGGRAWKGMAETGDRNASGKSDNSMSLSAR